MRNRTANDYGYYGVMAVLTSIVDRPDLATVTLAGNDVLRYLHAVCTQHTLDLEPGQATQALLLSPKGKVELAFRLAVLDKGVLLDTEAATAGALAERLARFVFRYDVTVGQPVRAQAASLLGPGADGALAEAGLPVPAPGRPGVAGAELVVHRTPAGVDLVGPAAVAAAAGLERAGVERAPAELWELVRVERGLPRAGHELTDDVLAEEAGLLGSHVHLDKGCYPGQETVARVHNLGQVQRRLAGLRFEPAGDGDADGLPAPRTDLVTDDGRRAGQLRSVVDHPRLGPIGLAYVRRVVDSGRRVRAGDRVATVVDLPFEA
jgi:tRNA-modifying protein YgfZ